MTGLLWRYGVPALIGALLAAGAVSTVYEWRLDAVRGERDSALADARECRAEVAAQNEAIDAGALECQQEVDAAARRAIEALGRRRPPPGTDAASMNDWWAQP